MTRRSASPPWMRWWRSSARSCRWKPQLTSSKEERTIVIEDIQTVYEAETDPAGEEAEGEGRRADHSASNRQSPPNPESIGWLWAPGFEDGAQGAAVSLQARVRWLAAKVRSASSVHRPRITIHSTRVRTATMVVARAAFVRSRRLESVVKGT